MRSVDRAVRVLLFDVLGTVVDVDSCVIRETTAALLAAGFDRSDAEAILAGCHTRLDDSMGEIRAGRSPWQKHRDLRRLALHEAVADVAQSALEPQVEEELSGVIHRLDPWPDSAAALRSLQRSVGVVGLSNADTAELVGLSIHGSLSWHALLSAELATSFKPDPAVYEMALKLLGVQPDEAVMVAAHPWDLRAAAALGLSTAYVGRPGAEPPRPDDDFDIVVNDLAELVPLLTR